MNSCLHAINLQRQEATNSSLRLTLTFKLQVPDDAPTPTKDAAIEVTLILRGIAGPYLGESDKGRMLIVLQNDIKEFNSTITHEIGHAINQTPKSSTQPTGLSAHPHQYTGHGGIGSHCSSVIKGGKHEKGILKNGEYPSGVCVMFHAGDSKCIGGFCDKCLPYVKATDVNEFGV